MSIVERYGSEFAGATQLRCASVLNAIAEEKGTALLQGCESEASW
jgi:hypothetical protein